jgi:hypothetical protein
MRTRRTIATVVFVLATLLLLGNASVLANGGKSKRVRYGAEIQTGDAASKRCRFDAELEPLLFRLATLRDKYRVARVSIQNASDRRLALSLAGDRMEVRLANEMRPAVLDLSAHDAGLWDSLPSDLRQAIAYPRGVDPGEEESVFVFIPVGESTAELQEFRYTIASLPAGPVNLRDMTSVKKR